MSSDAIQKNQILCVDDNADTVELLTFWLKRCGYEVHSAMSCAEALRLIERQEFNICIADYRLPDSTGFEFFQQARIKNPEMIRILNTGDICSVVKQQAAIAEVYLLPKPTDLDLLHQIIDRVTQC